MILDKIAGIIVDYVELTRGYFSKRQEVDVAENLRTNNPSELRRIVYRNGATGNMVRGWMGPRYAHHCEELLLGFPTEITSSDPSENLTWNDNSMRRVGKSQTYRIKAA